jgi:hypothetical protein
MQEVAKPVASVAAFNAQFLVAAVTITRETKIGNASA